MTPKTVRLIALLLALAFLVGMVAITVPIWQMGATPQ
jgi:hypothetical protein